MENQKIEEVKIIIELLGTPKGHIEETMMRIINKLKNEKGVKFLKNEIIHEPIQIETPPEVLESMTPEEKKKVKPLWSTFSEVLIEVDSIAKLIGLCFDYMPSSIEITKPEKFEVKSKEYNDLMNDLVGKLHEISFMASELAAENMYLKQNKTEKS